MAAKCSICSDSRQEAIDRDLLGNEPMRVIAERYGKAPSSLQRHRARHLMPRAASAMARHEEITTERLVSWLVGLQDQTAATILVLKAQREYAEARGWVREFRANAELLAKLKGLIDTGARVHVDARHQQLAVLAGMDTDDLRALAQAAREGQLDYALGAGTPPTPAPHTPPDMQGVPAPYRLVEPVGGEGQGVEP
jgi:hypothetical protein